MASQRPFHPWCRPQSRPCGHTDPASAHGNPSLPPCALFLTPALIVATAARERATPRAASIHDPSVQQPWRASAAAMAWPSPCRASAQAGAEGGVRSCEVSRNYIHVIQAQLLTHAVLALAQRRNPPSHRRHMLTDGQVDPVTVGRRIAPPTAASERRV
jgi:hypothetical protein